MNLRGTGLYAMLLLCQQIQQNIHSPSGSESVDHQDLIFIQAVHRTIGITHTHTRN